MNQATLKNKLVTIVTMSVIILGLFLSSYFLFLQESTVDLTKDIALNYVGESSNAILKVSVSNINYNQRKQAFMDSITYTVTPNENLKNGDVVVVEASYDQTLATTYHLKPINQKRTIMVEGLPQRIEDVSKIPYSFLLDINEAGQNFFQKHNDEIIEDHFIMFDDEQDVLISNNRLIYRLFLNSKTSDYDRIVDVYCLSAKGNMIDDEGNVMENSEYSIYYLVFYHEINDAYTIKNENVYGEKLITSENDLTDEDVLELVVQKYEKLFKVEQIY